MASSGTSSSPGAFRSLDELKQQFESDIRDFDLDDYVRNVLGAKRSGKFYNHCPVCEHDNNFYITRGKPDLWNCRSSTNNNTGISGGTIVDLLMAVNGLKESAALDKLKYEILRYDRREWTRAWIAQQVAAEKSGDEAGRGESQPRMERSNTRRDTDPGDGADDDYTEYYRRIAGGVTDPVWVHYVTAERGIRMEIALRRPFYPDFAWISPTTIKNQIAKGSSWRPDPTRRAIYALSRSSYAARIIDKGVVPKQYEKMNVGKAVIGWYDMQLLYEHSVVCLVEGVADAMSVDDVADEAGIDVCGVTINSVDNVDALIDALKAQPELPTATIIVCFDDDSPGRSATPGAVDALMALGLVVTSANICCGCKDPNDALIADRKRFREAVMAVQEQALALRDFVIGGREAMDTSSLLDKYLSPAPEQPQAAEPAAQNGQQDDFESETDKAPTEPPETKEGAPESEIGALPENQGEESGSTAPPEPGEPAGPPQAAEPLPSPEAPPEPDDEAHRLQRRLFTLDAVTEKLRTADDSIIEIRRFPKFSAAARIKKHSTIALAADTGTGKSSLSLNFLSDLLDKHPCLLFNLEMDELTVLRRLIAIRSGMEIDRIEGYNQDPATAQMVNDCVASIAAQKPLWIVNDLRYLEDIEALIKEAARGRDETVMVFIDHSLLVQTRQKYSIRYERFTQISEELRRMCRTYNITMFVLLQQSRAGKSNENERPVSSSLKESGSWENDATHVCFLWFDPVDKVKKIIITKNRNGGETGEYPLNYEARSQTYSEVRDQPDRQTRTTAAAPKKSKLEQEREELQDIVRETQIATGKEEPTVEDIAEITGKSVAKIRGLIRSCGAFVNGRRVNPAGRDQRVSLDGFFEGDPDSPTPFDGSTVSGRPGR